MKAIILSCSRTKGAGPTSALKLYDGPRWRTLRASLRHVTHSPEVFAFSAQHGIIRASSVISGYNFSLEKKLAVRQAPEGLALLECCSFLHLSMGVNYAEVLRPFLKIPHEWCGDRGLGDQRAAIWQFIIRYDIETMAAA